MFALEMVAAYAEQRDPRELRGQLLDQRRQDFRNGLGAIQRLESAE